MYLYVILSCMLFCMYVFNKTTVHIFMYTNIKYIFLIYLKMFFLSYKKYTLSQIWDYDYLLQI